MSSPEGPHEIPIEDVMGAAHPHPHRAVAVAADDAYAVPLHACLKSVTAHSPGLTVHVLDCGLTLAQRDSARATVGEAGALNFVRVPASALEALPLPACNSMATYARLRIDEFIEVDRVLYLDADTIARAPVSELFGIDLDGRAVAAVREMYTPTVSSDNGVTGWRELKLAEDTPYFNAGVMLIDIARWSELEIGAKAVAYLRRPDVAINLYDQEALNVALAGDWVELPAVWNVSRYWYKAERRTGPYATILEDARILHYLSEDKPWVAGNRVPASQTKEFFAAIDESALAGWRPADELRFGGYGL